MKTLQDLAGATAPIGRRLFLGTSAALIASTAFAATGSGAAPVAETAAGRVRGYHDGAIKVFKGIPYGAPTGGANRWMPPRKPASWSGVREATAFGDRSPQASGPAAFMVEEAVMLGYETMSEDCLNLNVWTPAVGPASGKRPVMVWFHGGGFAGGSGSAKTYDGTRLATKHDVVVVTVNHRLNGFGFLYLGGLNPAFADSGNAGMLDLVAALQWVHDNISHFGGDPSRVMIFGQSGGGGKVSTMMGVAPGKGLFHRAAAQSGSALRQATQEEATAAASSVLKQLNLSANQVAELQAVPQHRLLAALAAARANMRPVVDGRTLPAHPFDPQGSALSADVPFIMGSVETEVTFQQTYQLDPIDDARLHEMVKDTIRARADADVDRLIGLYRAQYPGRDNTYLLQTLASDWGTGDTMATQATRKAAQGAAPAYLYHFEKGTPVHNGKLHVPHTMEIAYVFDNLARGAAITGGVTPDRQAVADKMSALWTSFARTGTPSAPGVAWKPFNTQTRNILVASDTVRAVDDPRRTIRTAIADLKAAQPADARGAA